MKIEPEYVLGLQRSVDAQHGKAAADEMAAREAMEKARDSVQQAIGAREALRAVMAKLNKPDPPPAKEPIFTHKEMKYEGIRGVDEDGNPVTIDPGPDDDAGGPDREYGDIDA